MRSTSFIKLALLTSALLVSACSSEVKTGELTRRFAMTDDKGTQFGIVELSPLNGGTLYDMKGNLIGSIIPPTQTVASLQPLQ